MKFVDKMKSILIIHMYFGTLPNYFKFWLKSCEENRDIDFLIVTDNEIKTSSKNIIIHKSSLPEIKKRAQRLLAIPVSLYKPHKLCDYKPLFGLLMQEFSSKYDFWGYCDSDLIFGNIRHFLTDDVLSNFDYILGMGHFHIQRTDDPKFERIWKSARGVGDNAYYEAGFDPARFMELNNGPEWKECFESPANHIFDEFPYGVSFRYYQLYPNRVWTGYSLTGRCFDDVDPMPLYLRDLFNNYDAYKDSTYKKLAYILPFFQRISNGRKEFDDVVYEKCGNMLYRIGRTYDNDLIRNECLYAHFLHRKMHVMTAVTDRYLIRPNSFIAFENVTADKMIKWRNNHWLAIERKFSIILFHLKRSKTLWRKIKRYLGLSR